MIHIPSINRALFVVLFISTLKIYAQENSVYTCIPSAEVTVTTDEIILSSDKFQIRKDINKNFVVFYPEGEKNSFWYKIMVDSDCRFSFQISSADTTAHNYFFLYKEPEKINFCEFVKRKKIIPSRSGEFFYEEKPKGFVKISGNKKIEEVNFIQPVSAAKGEIYFLNVKHKTEADCGHYLKLIVSRDMVSFRATYPKCVEEENIVVKKAEKKYENKMEIIKPATVENNSQKEIIKRHESEINIAGNSNAEKIAKTETPKTDIAVSTKKHRIEYVTVSGVVLDSITKKPIQAELKWVDEMTGKEIVAHTNPQGEYSIALDEKVIYKLTCNAVGYRENTLKFIRQNLNSESLIQDFSMSSLEPGENFVLKHIYFYAATYAMKPESQPELEKLFTYLSSNDKVKIEIQGHTNGEGKVKKVKDKRKPEKGEGWNFHGNEKKLSKYRADAIKNYLVNNGISSDRILTEGMGATKMIYEEPKTQKERDVNKRVEVYILSASGDLALGQ